MKSKRWFLPLYQRSKVPFENAKIIVNTKNFKTFSFSDRAHYCSGGGLGGQNIIFCRKDSSDHFQNSKFVELFTKAICLFLNSKRIKSLNESAGYNQLSTAKLKDIEIPDLFANDQFADLIKFLAKKFDDFIDSSVSWEEVQKALTEIENDPLHFTWN